MGETWLSDGFSFAYVSRLPALPGRAGGKIMSDKTELGAPNVWLSEAAALGARSKNLVKTFRASVAAEQHRVLLPPWECSWAMRIRNAQDHAFACVFDARHKWSSGLGGLLLFCLHDSGLVRLIEMKCFEQTGEVVEQAAVVRRKLAVPCFSP